MFAGGHKKKPQKDLKAALITGRPIYFVGLNENASVCPYREDGSQNLEIQFWNKSRPMQVNTNRVQIVPNVEGRLKRSPT